MYIQTANSGLFSFDLMQARGKVTQSGPSAPEVAFVPSVTIKRDVTQTLGANFWASAAAACASHEGQQAAVPPAPEPAPSQPAVLPAGQGYLPSVRPPAIAAEALNFWQAAASGTPLPPPPMAGSGASHVPPEASDLAPQASGQTDKKESAVPSAPTSPQEPAVPKPMHVPSPSQKLAAAHFWEQAAQRSFSNGTQPDDNSRALAIQAAAAAAAEEPSRQRMERPRRTGAHAQGRPVYHLSRLSSIHHVYMCKRRCIQHQNGH